MTGSASDLQLGLDVLPCLWFESMFKRAVTSQFDVHLSLPLYLLFGFYR